jgi:putative Ca2+/H+ antiporter (TMEM165/GDT1 family)
MRREDFMNSTLIAFLFSTLAVTLAEMGDKTQLLAMAFATKYKATKVLIGVFIATVLNHALAVALGNYLTRFKGSEAWIQGLASLSFIFFGLWTIHGDKLDDDGNKPTKFGAVLTVSIAFFIAELGDKTQLATIALAAKFPDNPIGILMGTTTGMLIADAIGIVLGVMMCKRIPERTIKLVSAGAFIFFGIIGSYQTAIDKIGLNLSFTLIITVFLAIVSIVIGYILLEKSDKQIKSLGTVEEHCKIRDKK